MNNFQINHLMISSSDGIQLPSLLYFQERKVKTLVIFIHGSGSSSIIRMPELLNALASEIVKNDMDFLAFNNRGSGYITKFSKIDGDSYLGGMVYERIEDFHEDIEGVLDWAKEHGYVSFYLVGHSTGANKLVYEFSKIAHPMVNGLVLVGGGDDIGLQRKRYDSKLLSKVEGLLEETQGQHKESDIVATDLFPGEHPISWGSLGELLLPFSNYDIFPFERYLADPSRTDYFKQLRALKLPSLFIYGSQDFGTVISPKAALDVILSLKYDASIALIDEGDHSLHGHEYELAKQITAWINGLIV